MIIAIDGPAGSGKSTVAKMIAADLGFTFMNTGSFYRALALAVLRSLGGDESGAGAEKPDLENEAQWVRFAETVSLAYKHDGIYLNGASVEPYLRSDAVESIVAALSAIVPIRRLINKKIRAAAAGLNIVCEGRDMTTVVFPMPNVRSTSMLPLRHAHGVASSKAPAISRKPKYGKALKRGTPSTAIKRKAV